MMRKLSEWPFENDQTENVGPSDGCRGNVVLLAAGSKYDFHELGAYLGNVGSNRRQRILFHENLNVWERSGELRDLERQCTLWRTNYFS